MKRRFMSRAEKRRRERWLSAIFLAPTIVVFALFMFWPLIRTIELSLYDWNMVSPNKTFVGISNYLWIFTNETVLKVLGNTLLYIFLFVLINCVAPYVVAYVLSFVVKRFTSFYKSAMFMPSLISLVTAALVFSWLFNPLAGPLAIIVKQFGSTFPNWAQTNGLVIVVLTIITSWKMFGYNLITLLAGVSGISQDLIETARLEKTPPVEAFFKIILPLSSSTGIYVLLITIVWGLQWVFTPINMLTNGGPNNGSSNIIYAVYREAFTLFKTGRASALAIITMLIFGVLLLLEFKFVEKGVYYEN